MIGTVVLYAYRRRSVLPALTLSLLLVVILTYLIAYNETVRSFLLEVFEGTKVANKIEDITTTVVTEQTAESIEARIRRYQASLEAIFLYYPVVGSWWARYAGGHSALLDAFALYGIGGGMVMINMIYSVPIMWKKKDCSQVTMRVLNATIITMTFVALLDTMPFNLAITPTVLLPILLTDIESWSRENESIMDSELDSYRIGG